MLAEAGAERHLHQIMGQVVILHVQNTGLPLQRLSGAGQLFHVGTVRVDGQRPTKIDSRLHTGHTQADDRRGVPELVTVGHAAEVGETWAAPVGHGHHVDQVSALRPQQFKELLGYVTANR